MKRKITIVFNNRGIQPENKTDELVISFGELVSMIKNKSLIKHFFKYREAEFLTHNYNSVPWPFMNAVILRFLSTGKSYFKDDRGQIYRVTIVRLLSLFGQAVIDFLNKGRLSQQLTSEVDSLMKETEKKLHQKIQMELPSIYLRTDMWFGVTAGGSVGHIAGVLNNLDHFTGAPEFFSTDYIPTVRDDIKTTVILPNQRFRDFRELSTLNFNRTFFEEADRSLQEKPISFIYQRYSINNYSGVKLARKYQVPFILEYNGSEIWINKNWGGKPLKYEFLSMKIEDLNLRYADLVVVVSKPMKDELVQRGVDADKILVNPNGVDPDKYSPDIDGTAIRRKFGLEGKTVIGFIGTFGRWHGAEVLAEAFGKLLQNPANKEKLRLLMIGDGVTMKDVKEKLRQYQVIDECILTGIVPQKEGPAYMAACNILASPHVPNSDGTPFFGSPTKLFEYMAMGKVIVASDLDQIGEILEHKRTAWMVKPGDVDSLVQGLQHVADHPSFSTELGRRAREVAIGKYTWLKHTKRIMQKLNEIYHV